MPEPLEEGMERVCGLLNLSFLESISGDICRRGWLWWEGLVHMELSKGTFLPSPLNPPEGSGLLMCILWMSSLESRKGSEHQEPKCVFMGRVSRNW